MKQNKRNGERLAENERRLEYCPFCRQSGATEFPDGEIIHGSNPECAAYPRLKSLKRDFREVKIRLSGENK
jgi:hypothetical protein